MRSLHRPLLSLALSVCTLFAASSRAAVMVFVPNSDFVCFFNLDELNRSSFAQALEERGQAFSAGQLQGALGQGAGAEMLESLGLTKDDLESVFISANLSQISPMSMQSPGPDDIDLLASINFKTGTSLDRLQGALPEDADLKTRTANYKGYDVLVVQTPGPRNGELVNSAAFLIAGGKTLVVGPEHSVKSAIDRAADNRNARATSEITELKTHAPGSSNLYMIYVLSPAVRQMLQSSAAGDAQRNSRSPMAMAQMAAADIRGACLAAICDDDMQLQITMLMGSDDTARQLTQMLDSMLVSAAKMFLASQTGNTPMKLTETIRAESVPRASTRLSLTLSQADLETLMKLGNQPDGATGGPGPGTSENLHFDLTQ